MNIAQALIAELQMEAASTRKLFNNLPENLPDFKPHEKSMSLTLLASHVAELPTWTIETMTLEKLDLSKINFVPKDFKTKSELIAFFNENIEKAVACLEKATDADFMVIWSMCMGEKVQFAMPRINVMRSMIMNHFIHHRAQITVYMRLLNLPIAGMYGLSADEKGA